MDNRAIGVFDSGLGGLVAAQTLRQRLPGENIIYFADEGRMPYGGRSREELVLICKQDIDFLLDFDVKLILSACGTTSSVALPELVSSVPLPVFGVIEPAADAICRLTNSGRVGIIATLATVSGGAYQRRLRSLCPDIEITAVPCPKLVPLIESGRFRPDDPLLMQTLDEYLSDIVRADVDALLLGCTHYSLAIDAIASYMGASVEIVDAGESAANTLIDHILSNSSAADDTRLGSTTYYTSGNSSDFAAAAKLILGLDISLVSEIDPFPISFAS